VAAVGSHEDLLEDVPRYAEVLARDEALAGEGTP
jgi:hypothetical protein